MVENESKNNVGLPYDVYLKERNILVDAEREGARSFDKAVLTLSAAALGLSIAFIRQIAPSPDPSTIGNLIIAWAAFGASIASTLTSFLTSQWACSRQRDILDVQQEKKGDQHAATNWPAFWTTFLNVSSIISFIIGALFLAYFAAINLNVEEATMAANKKGYGYVPQKKPRKPPLQEGYTPPKKPPLKPPPGTTPKK